MPDITVMTWNIQNLFPVGHADGPATQQEYDDKIAGLAEVINAVEPDLLALQEVGPEQVLADLNAACNIDFDNRLIGIPDGRGSRVALLSPRLLSGHWVAAPPTGPLSPSFSVCVDALGDDRFAQVAGWCEASTADPPAWGQRTARTGRRTADHPTRRPSEPAPSTAAAAPSAKIAPRTSADQLPCATRTVLTPSGARG
jgi:hypothetical protein